MARQVRAITVSGIEDLAQQLKKLQATATGEPIRQALLESAQMIRDDAARRAPIAPYATRQRGQTYQPGGLRKSLKAASGRKYKNFLQAFAFTLKNAAPHAHLVEFGTKPHTIAGKKMRIAARAFQWLARVGDQVRTKIQHPGSRPNPFFQSAIKAQRSRIKRLLEQRVKAAFDAIGRAA